jgi:uncharacterized cupin superfamily protein
LLSFKGISKTFRLAAAGKRACPNHFRHAQAQMFVILDGHETLRMMDEMIPIEPCDVIFIPPGPKYPH